jgi:hypothetical protein
MICTLLLLGCCIRATVGWDIDVSNLRSRDDLIDVFTPHPGPPDRWLGADSSASLVLKQSVSGQTRLVSLWIWADTLVGSMESNHTREVNAMPHNSFSLWNGNMKVAPTWCAPKSLKEGALSPCGQTDTCGAYYWTINGLTNEQQDKVAVFAMVISIKGFANVTGTDAIIIQNPLLPATSPYFSKALPLGNLVMWTLGTARGAAGFIYVMGRVTNTADVQRYGLNASDVLLARVDEQTLWDPASPVHMELMGKDSEFMNFTDSEVLSEAGVLFADHATEGSLQYDDQLGLWYWCGLQAYEPNFSLRFSTTPWGWAAGAAKSLPVPSNISHAPGFVTYSCKAHPELSPTRQQGTSNLVFSFNTNTHTIADLKDHPEIYHPRFFEVGVTKVAV